jgi:purine-binding chemotaxis protein CheW
MTQLSTFRVGRYLFGVDVCVVQEVVRLHGLTPVPLAAPVIAGLINLRGEVLTAVDLRVRLGLPLGADHRDPVNVVVRVDEEAISLLVDEMGAVLDVSQLPFQATPGTVDEAVRDLLHGSYALPERLLLSLDVRRLLDHTVGSFAA